MKINYFWRKCFRRKKSLAITIYACLLGIGVGSSMLLLGFESLPGLTGIKWLGNNYFSEGKSNLSIAEKYGNIDAYAGLPVREVTYHPATSPGAGPHLTAIFIPQIHRNPDTALQDQANDNAQKVQGQIYDIISFLTKEKGFGFVMTEGELYGPIPENKNEELKKRIALRDKLASQAEELKNGLVSSGLSRSETQSINQNIEAVLAKLEREITLWGAAHRVKAENQAVTLYGAETPSTYEKSAKLVINYVYLKDRMAELSPVAVAGGSPRYSNSPALLARGENHNSLLDLFFKEDPTAALTLNLEILKLSISGGGNGLVTKAIDDLQKTLAQISELNQGERNKETLSKTDNPYQSVFNPELIGAKLKEAEKDIESVVVNQRNKETAENFVRALGENHQAVGILQFGAGHQDGLIKELNQAGVSVIEVVPTSVE